MRVYFVRHGESESWAKNVHQGHETALSALGRQQAKQVVARFRTIPLELIVSSKFIRAQETARIVHEALDVPLEISELFHEWKGPSETYGKDLGDMRVQMIYDEIDVHLDDPNWHYSDEENFFDLRNRVETAVNDLSSRSVENILVVTHGAVLLMILGWVCFGEQLSSSLYMSMFHTYQLHNTGICEFELNSDGKWHLVTWNDHVHLENLAV